MESRIAKFNNALITQNIDSYPLGLFYGQMGICIYLYHQARIYKEIKYENLASKILDNIRGNLHQEMPVGMESGLTGICLGIRYLIKSGFVKGNANSILKDLEDKVFRDVYYTYLPETKICNAEELTTLVHISFYFCKRLEDSKLSINDCYLFQNLIIKIINKVEQSPITNKYVEPFFFSPTNYFLPIYLVFLNKVYAFGFYNYKIDKIWNEMSDKLRSAYPLLPCNRLYLALSMQIVNQEHQQPLWSEHIDVLLSKIDLSQIITFEFRNKNILPNNGLTGFYYLLKMSGKLNVYNRDRIAKKIAISQLWDVYLTSSNIPVNKHYMSLFNGLGGVILAYQECMTKKH
jgi:Lanthionine synthetase C-like protein.